MLEILFCLVVGVSDGDTIKARCGEPGAYQEVKVRLNAIDAPERRQAFGNRSRQLMSDLIYKKDVRLECLPKPDRYKRRVCSVFVQKNGQTIDAGHEMIANGLAWNYPQFTKQLTPDQQVQYKLAQNNAMSQKLGLWQDKNPIPPWEFRKGRR